MKVKFAPDFENLCPPHSADELATMEASIKAHPAAFGPVIVWANGGNVIVEGYARNRLFGKLGLIPKYLKVDFPDRQTALSFAAAAQAGRRNMTPGAAATLLAKYPPTKSEKGHRGPIHQSEVIAEKTGVSERTSKRAIRVAAQAEPEVVNEVIRGEKTVAEAEKTIPTRPKASSKPKQHPKRPELKALSKLDTQIGQMIRAGMEVHKDLAPSKHFEEFKRGLEIACQALTKWRSESR